MPSTETQHRIITGPLPESVIITTWRLADESTCGESKDCAWQALVRAYRGSAARVKDKADLRAPVFAAIRPECDPEHCVKAADRGHALKRHRCDDAVIGIGALVFDHDFETGEDPVSWDAVAVWLRAQELAAILYESPSHQYDNGHGVGPRWRLVIPLSEPWTDIAKWRVAYSTFRLYLEAATSTAFDRKCCNPSRIFYPPTRPIESCPVRRVDWLDGAALDLAATLATFPAPAADPRPYSSADASSVHDLDDDDRVAFERYAQGAFDSAVRAVTSAGKGERNATLNSETFSLVVRFGAGGILQIGMIERCMLEAAKQAGLTESESRKTIASAISGGRAQATPVRDLISEWKRGRRQRAPQPTPRHDPETEEVAAAAGTDSEVADVTPDRWEDSLIYSGNGDKRKLIGCIANLTTILAHDPRWQGVLAYDEFADRITFRKAAPWHEDDGTTPAGAMLSDADGARLMSWFMRRWFIKIGADVAFAAIQIASRLNTTHPVREYLTGLHWDGRLRIHGWTVDYLGAEDTPYHRCVGMRWLIGAVARIMEPGCQMDACLVLEGEQNAGKSRSTRTLASPDWYCDDVGDLHSKDSADALRGKWIVELGEMASIRKADIELQKAYLSRRVDHYRAAYARITQDCPRQCVFVGTTNADTYHVDPTGLRRFWAVRCGKTVDLVAIERDRDQIWAEALSHYRNAEPHWLQPDEIPAQVAEQAERREVDPWTERILDWCEGQVCAVTVDRVLADCIGIEIAKRTRADALRVGAVLRANGWVQKGMVGSRGSRRAKVWVVKPSPVSVGITL